MAKMERPSRRRPTADHRAMVRFRIYLICFVFMQTNYFVCLMGEQPKNVLLRKKQIARLPNLRLLNNLVWRFGFAFKAWTPQGRNIDSLRKLANTNGNYSGRFGGNANVLNQ